MSQPGSPTGAQGSTAAENMLGQILQNLQLGQAQIAREQAASTAALTEVRKNLKSKPGVVDVKGFATERFKGSHEEAAKHWKAWSYKFETWFSSQWPTGQEALDCVRGKADGPVTAHDLLNSTIRDIDAAHLHVALVSLTSQMPMTQSTTLVRNAASTRGDGYVGPMNQQITEKTFGCFDVFSVHRVHQWIPFGHN